MLGKVYPSSKIIPIENSQPLNSSFSEVNYPLRKEWLVDFVKEALCLLNYC